MNSCFIGTVDFTFCGGEIRGNVSAFLELVLKSFVHICNVASSSLDYKKNDLITLQSAL